MSKDKTESLVEAMMKKSQSNVQQAKEFIHTIKNKTNESTVVFTESETSTVYDLIAKEDKNAVIPMDKLCQDSNLAPNKVNAIVLNLIQSEKIVGFINDKGTPNLSDDLLILVEKRFIDEYDDEDD